jgi:hypothetical protein
MGYLRRTRTPQRDLSPINRRKPQTNPAQGKKTPDARTIILLICTAPADTKIVLSVGRENGLAERDG